MVEVETMIWGPPFLGRPDPMVHVRMVLSIYFFGFEVDFLISLEVPSVKLTLKIDGWNTEYYFPFVAPAYFQGRTVRFGEFTLPRCHSSQVRNKDFLDLSATKW